MHLAVVQTAFVVIISAVVVSYVLSRRERRQLHWLISGLLCTLAIWAIGMGIRHVPGGESWEKSSLIAWFFGVAFLPPLWLAVAVRLTGTRRLLSGRAALVGLGLPALLGFLALLTNDQHGLMIRDSSYAVLDQGASHYAGQLYWVQLSWSYGIILGGAVVYLRQAWRMTARGDAWRGLAVMVGAALPLSASVPRALGWLPGEISVTPAAAGVATVLLMSIYWRHHLSELAPLARQDVIENLPDAVVVTNSRGRIVDVNPAAEKLFAAPADALRGRLYIDSLAQLAGRLDPDDVAQARGVVEAGEGPAFSRLRLGDGRHLEVTGAVVHGRDGEVTGYYSVLRDRTQQRNLERFLHQSQRLETVAGLAAGVAHEVNNPLSYVRANLNHVKSLAEETRESPVSKPEELEELALVADECIDGVDRIARIIESMLRFSHLEAGGPETVDANEVVADAIRLAQLHETSSVEIAASTGSALPRVWGSAENLVQAVLNLLVNGKQALNGREDACIRVRTRPAGAGVVIEVSDNGPGVPDELRDRIFAPFFTTKGPGEGSGLGLAISAEIARKHGGALELDSVRGAGATFRLRLPARAARP